MVILSRGGVQVHPRGGRALLSVRTIVLVVAASSNLPLRCRRRRRNRLSVNLSQSTEASSTCSDRNLLVIRSPVQSLRHLRPFLRKRLLHVPLPLLHPVDDSDSLSLSIFVINPKSPSRARLSRLLLVVIGLALAAMVQCRVRVRYCQRELPTYISPISQVEMDMRRMEDNSRLS